MAYGVCWLGLTKYQLVGGSERKYLKEVRISTPAKAEMSLNHEMSRSMKAPSEFFSMDGVELTYDWHRILWPTYTKEQRNSGFTVENVWITFNLASG